MILNMVELVKEGTDDVDILVSIAQEIQRQEVENPPIKEIMKQISSIRNASVVDKAQKVSNFVKSLNQVKEDFDKKRITPEEFQKSTIKLCKNYNG